MTFSITFTNNVYLLRSLDCFKLLHKITLFLKETNLKPKFKQKYYNLLTYEKRLQSNTN